jgi:hypothetical protein
MGYGFIDHLYIPLGTTSNYSAIADLHALQITATNTKHSPARSAFSSRFLVTDVNSGDSSASRAQVLPVRRISHNWTIAPSLLSLPCRTQLNCQPWTDSIPNSARLGSSLYSIGEDPTENTVSNNYSTVIDACLPIRCLETGCVTVVLLLRAYILWALPSNNGCCLESHSLATGLYATL